jgi:SAM-dependent methyltransferase
MDVPQTVTAALDDRPVSGAVCLEAGAGVGNVTAGLLAAGARRVYAVTNDRGDARTVRERVVRDARGRTARDAPPRTDHDAPPRTDHDAPPRTDHDAPPRTALLEADVRALPLSAGSVDVVTAHGLFNVLPPETLAAVAEELTRVAAPGCHLVVDDYRPLPADAAVGDLFAVENAASELARGRPALTFYPARVLRDLFVGRGWTFDRNRTLLDPVPWTGSHLAAHAAATREAASTLPAALRDPLIARADRLAERIGRESAGTMYSVAFRLAADDPSHSNAPGPPP